MTDAKHILIKFKERIFKKDEKEIGTALDSMNRIMKFINFFAQIPGLRFTDGWKKSYKILNAAFMNFLALALGIYSLYVTFPSTDNIILVGGLACITTVSTKLACVTRNHDKFMSVLKFIFKVFKTNSSGPRERILMDITKKIHYHLKINILGFVAGFFCYSAYPFYDCIFNGQLTLPSPVLVPGVNPNHLRGFFITNLVNMVIMLFCITICIATSSLFFVFVDAYYGLVSLIEHDFETFDKMCAQEASSRTKDVYFRNIMMGLMDLARFNSYMNELYGLISTVQITVSYIVVVCCAAAFLAFSYGSGLGGCVSFYTELLIFCYMGQLLDNMNKRIVTVICNAKWYTYDVKYQKDMMMVLYTVQNMQPILLGNMFPLNFHTGLRITNNIYSLIMFMVEMFN
ncbi:putative odorant receptor 83c [Bradysia coprophila]|uniref:putative odorant receptor 83c n=1 Tax=Bradysia coprophila TaxID=38358 RepID=UPI00187D82CC|nr:putative odorant receptor 83c [Bradysia coprophila]XP_037026581.1 putative odorant receptor 83c [Bradysia coprophila]